MRTETPGFDRGDGRRAPRAELKLVPSRGVIAFIRRRRIWRIMGMTPMDLGVRPRWFERGPLRPRAAARVWILQKNSGRRRRVKAVATTPEQLSALNVIHQKSANSGLFTWSGFDLDGRGRQQADDRPLAEVHALVMLHHAHSEPGATSAVRVVAVFVDIAKAQRALEERVSGARNQAWAVITYPVGEMLF